jgi:hypothetical protein
MNNTSLIDFENNLKIKTDINNKIIIGEIKDTINFRLFKYCGR